MKYECDSFQDFWNNEEITIDFDVARYCDWLSVDPSNGLIRAKCPDEMALFPRYAEYRQDQSQ